MADIKVRWEIEDGYVGGARPHYTRVSAEDFQHCETEDQVRDALDEIIEDDFRAKIGFSVRNEDEVISAWRRAQSERTEP